MSQLKRFRTFQGLLYGDEQERKELQEKLEKHCFNALISPRHDKDTLEDGTPKKAHYHVLIRFDNGKSRKTASKIFKELNLHHQEKYTRDDTFVVRSIKACARYMCHLDQPNKHLYNTEEVTVTGALDYKELTRTKLSTTKELNEIEDIVKEYNIQSIMSLLDFLKCNYPYLVGTFRKKHIYLNNLCKAQHFDDKQKN